MIKISYNNSVSSFFLDLISVMNYILLLQVFDKLPISVNGFDVDLYCVIGQCINKMSFFFGILFVT